ncbi:MAG: hypothetical protein ACKO4L_13630, partial [Nodosilinea sp.]
LSTPRPQPWWQRAAIGLGWWCLSQGLFLGLWELIVALGWVNPIILPAPHQFIAEISNQEQFLAPRIGVQRVGGNFVLLTAVVATLKRVSIGLILGFGAALLLSPGGQVDPAGDHPAGPHRPHRLDSLCDYGLWHWRWSSGVCGVYRHLFPAHSGHGECH